MSVVAKSKNGRSLPNLVEDFFNTDRFPGMSGFFGEFPNLYSRVPEANISENKKEFAVELAVPGLKSDDFKVNIHDGILSISAEKEEKSDEEGENFRRKEFSYNSFSRSFYLPENLSSEKIDAKYENGVLRIKLPKKQATPAASVKTIKVS